MEGVSCIFACVCLCVQHKWVNTINAVSQFLNIKLIYVCINVQCLPFPSLHILYICLFVFSVHMNFPSGDRGIFTRISYLYPADSGNNNSRAIATKRTYINFLLFRGWIIRWMWTTESGPSESWMDTLSLHLLQTQPHRHKNLVCVMFIIFTLILICHPNSQTLSHTTDMQSNSKIALYMSLTVHFSDTEWTQMASNKPFCLRARSLLTQLLLCRRLFKKVD